MRVVDILTQILQELLNPGSTSISLSVPDGKACAVRLLRALMRRAGVVIDRSVEELLLKSPLVIMTRMESGNVKISVNILDNLQLKQILEVTVNVSELEHLLCTDPARRRLAEEVFPDKEACEVFVNTLHELCKK